MKKDSLSIRTPTWFYARLLAIYPVSFQEKYGREMLLTFRDVCRRENSRYGISGLVFFWLEIIIDLASTALQEHISEVRMLSTNQGLIRFTGVLGALGGILSIIIGVTLIRGGLGDDVTAFQAALFILTYLLIAVGSTGFFFAGRHERKVNAALGVLLFGAIIGAIGPILMAADIGLGWIMWAISLLIQGAGFLLLGVTTRKNSGFVRPAWLPLALGITILTLTIIGITLSQTASDTVQATLMGLTLGLLGASWLILGLLLLSGNVRTDALPPTVA
jgi:hypothetical protein